MGHYTDRLVSIDEALSHVEPGDHVWVCVGQLVAPLVSGLLGRAEPDRRITATGWFAQDLEWYTPEIAELLKLDIIFANPQTRQHIHELRADYTPWWIWGGHKARREGRPDARAIDATFIRVSPPNAAGFCCLGGTVWDAQTVVSLARKTIAITSDRIPHTFGESWIHESQIDWFVEQPPDAAMRPAGTVDVDIGPWCQPIADHVSGLVSDGDTFQVGLGSTTSRLAQLGAFDGRSDLGYFAELTVPGIVSLAEQGVINGSRMTTHTGRFVATNIGNGLEDLLAINQNPRYEMQTTEYLHNPATISQQDNMVSINNALAIDLSGQIAASHFGPMVYSGTGGQFSFHVGAYLSNGGRAVTVLPSTASGGKVSRIVPQFERGQIVTIPRDLADTVVTEHGVANLLNKNVRERAAALVEIAHPDFRDELRREAKQLFGI